jgi:hypothetical protein
MKPSGSKIIRVTHPGAAIPDGVAALSAEKAANAVYTAFAEQHDASPEDLDRLAEMLIRLSIERKHQPAKKDLP